MSNDGSAYVLIEESGNHATYAETVLAVSLVAGHFDKRVAKHNSTQRLEYDPTYLRIDVVPVEPNAELSFKKGAQRNELSTAQDHQDLGQH
jgi:hypothetical protein